MPDINIMQQSLFNCSFAGKESTVSQHQIEVDSEEEDSLDEEESEDDGNDGVFVDTDGTSFPYKLAAQVAVSGEDSDIEEDPQNGGS